MLTDPREGVLQDMPNRLWWPSIESALYLRKTSEVGDQSRSDLQARVQAAAAQRLPSRPSQPRDHPRGAHRLLAARGLGLGLCGTGSGMLLRCSEKADNKGLPAPDA